MESGFGLGLVSPYPNPDPDPNPNPNPNPNSNPNQAEEKFGEACVAFGKVLELEPNNKDAKSGLGVTQMQAERQRRAQAS